MKSLPILVCSAAFGVVSLSRAGLPSVASSLPEGALGFAEVSSLSDTVRALRSSRTLDYLLSTDEWKKFESSPEYLKVNAVRTTAELMLGSSLWDAAAELLGGRLGVALYPAAATGGKPQPVAVWHLEDTKTLKRGKEILQPLLGAGGKPVDTSKAWPGSLTWNFKDQAWLSMNGSWIVGTTDKALLERTIAVLGSAADRPATLAAQPGFSAMDRTTGDTHQVRLWVDAPRLKQMTGSRFGLPQKAEDGAASLMLGGLIELADHSTFGAATLDIRGQEVEGTVTLGADPAKLPEPASLWYVQHPANGVIPLPSPAGTIAAFTIHRKLGEWYRHRDQLLADRLLPGFDTFETNIGNLLPQKDFGQDVLPLIGDNFTFIAALQNYSHLDGAPGIKLPAFAGIFDMPKPEEGADTFQLFFQTLGAILNLQAGQENRQPSVMDAEIYQGTRITWSRYLTKPKGDRLAVAYNFQPAAAAVGRKYIVATSVQLCRDLIDHFKKPESGAWRNHNSEIKVDIAGLAKLAGLNEGFLRSQDIQKGNSPEAASRRVALLIKALEQLDTVHYHSEAKDGLFQMHLSTSWK